MKIRLKAIFILIGLIMFLLVACKPVKNDPIITSTSTAESLMVSPTQTSNTQSGIGSFFGLTYQNADGTRMLEGTNSLPDIKPLEIPLSGPSLWLVATPYRGGSLWTVALEDGNLESFYLYENQLESVDLGRGPLPSGTPPLILVQDDTAYLVNPPSPEASSLTHPFVPDPESGRFVFFTEDGALVLWEHGLEKDRLAVNALPDARILQDEKGRLLFLSDPTDSYDHGVLGDGLEASSFSLVETDPSLRLINKVVINEAVIEGINPIWADLNGDGQREILVTISDAESGARLVVFSESGEVLAESPSAGQGYRWRHQLTAAPLGPNGEILIVDVLRPHLDATVEFFAWEGKDLALKASLPGYSSHRIGSRNLDMALIGDFNGNELLEVVVPDLDQSSINGIELREDEAFVAWSVSLGGKLTSNLAGTTLEDGSVLLGAGVGEKLLIWE